MTITKEESLEMLEAAKPLMKWISEHCHPHCDAIVDSCTVRLTEGVATQKTDEFIND